MIHALIALAVIPVAVHAVSCACAATAKEPTTTLTLTSTVFETIGVTAGLLGAAAEESADEDGEGGVESEEMSGGVEGGETLGVMEPPAATTVPATTVPASSGTTSGTTSGRTSATSSAIPSTPSTPSTPHASPPSGTQGRGTFYTPSADNCGTHATANDLVVAIARSIYTTTNSQDVSAMCGRQIQVSYNGNSVTVTVVDLCESCGPLDLDLLPAAFQHLALLDTGVIPVTWTWV